MPGLQHRLPGALSAKGDLCLFPSAASSSGPASLVSNWCRAETSAFCEGVKGIFHCFLESLVSYLETFVIALL